MYRMVYLLVGLEEEKKTKVEKWKSRAAELMSDIQRYVWERTS